MFNLSSQVLFHRFDVLFTVLVNLVVELLFEILVELVFCLVIKFILHFLCLVFVEIIIIHLNLIGGNETVSCGILARRRSVIFIVFENFFVIFVFIFVEVLLVFPFPVRRYTL